VVATQRASDQPAQANSRRILTTVPRSEIQEVYNACRMRKAPVHDARPTGKLQSDQQNYQRYAAHLKRSLDVTGSSEMGGVSELSVEAAGQPPRSCASLRLRNKSANGWCVRCTMAPRTLTHHLI